MSGEQEVAGRAWLRRRNPEIETAFNCAAMIEFLKLALDRTISDAERERRADAVISEFSDVKLGAFVKQAAGWWLEVGEDLAEQWLAGTLVRIAKGGEV